MSYILNTTHCRALVSGLNVTAMQGVEPSIELYETLLLVIGFGTFATLIAILFGLIRTNVYKDKVCTSSALQEH